MCPGSGNVNPGVNVTVSISEEAPSRAPSALTGNIRMNRAAATR